MLHWQTVIGVGTKDLRGLVHDRWMRHGGHLEATHMVIHGDVGAQDSLFFWGLDGPGLRLGLSMDCGWDLDRDRDEARLLRAGEDQEGCVVLVGK